MLLNYRLRTSKTLNQTIPIIMIHGLFGNLSNLGILSTALSKYYDIIQVDLRNHGQSPHHSIMTYEVMAQDIVTLLKHFMIEKCIVIGHSMGGKIAMTLSILAKQYIEKVIILDIAPKKYHTCKYQNVFSTINYINNSKIKDKNHINSIMQKNHLESKTILFLLKSFQKGTWNFNFQFIMQNYANINDWTMFQICQKPFLFIRGTLSSYIKDSYIKNIHYQFPASYIKTIQNAGHWVHYDKPAEVFNIIKTFLLTKSDI